MAQPTFDTVPAFAGVEIWGNMPLYDTCAISKTTCAIHRITRPGTKYAGESFTKNKAPINATTIMVNDVTARWWFAFASARTPAAGAITATNRPASAVTIPSAAVPESWSPATLDVRYGVNTNVMMTALNAAEPQSHSAHATIVDRVAGAGACSGAAAGFACVAGLPACGDAEVSEGSILRTVCDQRRSTTVFRGWCTTAVAGSCFQNLKFGLC